MRLLSLGLFSLLGVFLVVFGVFYASVDSMLFFHAAAVPEAARAEMLPLYLALMKLIGGASAALGLLCLYVTFGPLRNRAPFAAAALAIAIAAPVLMAPVLRVEARAQSVPGRHRRQCRLQEIVETSGDTVRLNHFGSGAQRGFKVIAPFVRTAA